MLEIISSVFVSVVVAYLSFALVGAFLESGSRIEVSREKLCIIVASVACLIGIILGRYLY